MGTRSYYIWQISKALKEIDPLLQCDSIPQMKKNLPFFVNKDLRSIEDIKNLLSEIESANREQILQWSRKPRKQTVFSQRDLDIYGLRRSGCKVAQIAKDFGISKERVRQICARLTQQKIFLIMPPTPKQLANLKPGVGRPPRDTAQINLTLPQPLLALIDRVAAQQGWKRSYTIEVYLRKGLNLVEFGGYSADDLDSISKGAPIE